MNYCFCNLQLIEPSEFLLYLLSVFIALLHVDTVQFSRLNFNGFVKITCFWAIHLSSTIVNHTIENPTHIITHQWGHSCLGFPNGFFLNRDKRANRR